MYNFGNLNIDTKLSNLLISVTMKIKLNPFWRVMIVFFAVVFLFSSCKNIGKVKIGFLIPAGEGYRWIIDQGYIEEAAQKAGVEVVTLSANNDENLQQKQAHDLLESGVDVLIVVAANSNTAAAIVRDAQDKKVPVIAYDRIIKNCDLDYFVTFEGEKIGTLMTDHALSLKPKGNYILLFGEASDMNAQIIKDAQEKALEPYIQNQQIKILYKSFINDWSSDNAHQIMKKVLAFVDEPVDAIITSYDGLAMGAVKALEDYDYAGGIVITGQDAEIEAIKAIVDEKMTLTVYKSIKTISGAAIDLAIEIAKGKKGSGINSTVNNGRVDVPTVLLTPVAVDKNNIKETIIADGFFTKEQVYGE